MTTLTAIRKEPARVALVAPDTPNAAVAAITVLADRLDPQDRGIVLTPAIKADYDVYRGKLHVSGRMIRSNGGKPLTVIWTWGRQNEATGRYEIGWHPDDSFHELREWDRALAQMMWDALNPGKRLLNSWRRSAGATN